nr:unnamed protein product [Naegleria fowleri]
MNVRPTTASSSSKQGSRKQQLTHDQPAQTRQQPLNQSQPLQHPHTNLTVNPIYLDDNKKKSSTSSLTVESAALDITTHQPPSACYLMTHTPSDMQKTSQVITPSVSHLTQEVIQNIILTTTPNHNSQPSNFKNAVFGSTSPILMIPILPPSSNACSNQTPCMTQSSPLHHHDHPSYSIMKASSSPNKKPESTAQFIFPIRSTTKIYDTPLAPSSSSSSSLARSSSSIGNNHHNNNTTNINNNLFYNQFGDCSITNYNSSTSFGFMGFDSVPNSNFISNNNNNNSNECFYYLNPSSSPPTAHVGFVNNDLDSNSINMGIETMQQQQNINISGLLNSMLSQMAHDNTNSSSSAISSTNQNNVSQQTNSVPPSEFAQSPNLFINTINNITSIPISLFGMNTPQTHPLSQRQQQLGENKSNVTIFATANAHDNLTLNAATMQQFHLPQAGIPMTSNSSLPISTNSSFINTSPTPILMNPPIIENPSNSLNLTPQSLCNSSTDITATGEVDLPNQFAVLPKKPAKARRTSQNTGSMVATNFHPVTGSTDTTVGLSSTLNSLNSLLLKKMAVDVYYDITSAGHPFLPREELERLPVNDDQKNNLAFMFSLQALCYQRFGMAKQATESFEKAKSLALISANESNVFNTACTLCNLAMYCNSAGDRENGQIFSKFINLKMLRDPNFREHQNPEQLKALIQMKKIADIAGGTGYYGDDTDLSEISKLILSIYQYATGGERQIPPEMMMIAKQPLNMETLPQYLSLLDCVMKLMLIYESKGQHFSQTQKKMTKYIYYGMSYGLKIVLLKISGYEGPELEEAADKITQLCRTSTFTFVPAFLIEPVGAAMDVHFQILKKVDQGERSSVDGPKASRLLRRDIEAIKLLKLRYPLVCAKFDTLVEEAEKLLDRRGKDLTVLLDGEFYSSNPGGITIIEDELGKLIEGEVPASVSSKRKNHNDEDEYSPSRGYSANYVPPKNQNPPTSNLHTSTSAQPSSSSNAANLEIGNFTFTSISNNHVISGNSNDIGINPITFLSAEDYELLFGDDDTDDEQPFEL